LGSGRAGTHLRQLALGGLVSGLDVLGRGVLERGGLPGGYLAQSSDLLLGLGLQRGDLLVGAVAQPAGLALGIGERAGRSGPAFLVGTLLIGSASRERRLEIADGPGSTLAGIGEQALGLGAVVHHLSARVDQDGLGLILGHGEDLLDP